MTIKRQGSTVSHQSLTENNQGLCGGGGGGGGKEGRIDPVRLSRDKGCFKTLFQSQRQKAYIFISLECYRKYATMGLFRGLIASLSKEVGTALKWVYPSTGNWLPPVCHLDSQSSGDACKRAKATKCASTKKVL